MTKCPYGNIVCISGKRYRPTEKMPEYKLPVDLPNLLYVGECHRCVKTNPLVRYVQSGQYDIDRQINPFAPFIALTMAAAMLPWVLLSPLFPEDRRTTTKDMEKYDGSGQ